MLTSFWLQEKHMKDTMFRKMCEFPDFGAFRYLE